MLYTLLAVYGGIGFLCTILLIAMFVRKGQTDHLGRPPKSQKTNITVINSPLHRNVTQDNDSSQGASSQPITIQHRNYAAAPYEAESSTSESEEQTTTGPVQGAPEAEDAPPTVP